MRFLAFWLLLCLLAGTPFPSQSLTELTPVEILCLRREGETVLAHCDGDLAARGTSVQEAVENLYAAAPGRLELGTVDFAVFTDLAPTPLLRDLGLRPAVTVCTAPPVENADALAVYLRTHGGNVTLGALEENPSLPVPRLTLGEMGLVASERK